MSSPIVDTVHSKKFLLESIPCMIYTGDICYFVQKQFQRTIENTLISVDSTIKKGRRGKDGRPFVQSVSSSTGILIASKVPNPVEIAKSQKWAYATQL